MRILHLTDLHFISENKFDQDNLRNALISSLKKDDKIDFVFFTGDLVFAGKDIEDFRRAKTLLLDTIVSELSVKKENVFICAGNHDVYRNQELQDVANSLNKISSNEELDNYINNQNGRSLQASMANLSNYTTFSREFYSEYGIDGQDSLNELSTIHKRTFENKKIVIVTINSAWRAIDSVKDRGNLLFPLSVLKDTTKKAKDEGEIRILLMHHPISDFKDWNASEIEDIIYNDYLMMFSGHVHKKKQSVQIRSEEGIFCCTAAATLSLEKEANMGYSIIDLDLETYSLNITNRLYNKADNAFYQAQQAIPAQIPVSLEKSEQNAFRHTIRKRWSEEIERANELFISYNEKDSQNGFLQIFSNPIIKTKPRTQIASETDNQSVLFEDLTLKKENFVLYGKDKSGKTSILTKILIDLLRDSLNQKIIPLYINHKEYKGNGKSLNVINQLSRYYEINRSKSKELPTKYAIKLLIDNYDPNDSQFNDDLSKFLEENSNAFFVATVEETLLTTFSSLHFDGRVYSNLFIHEISRSEVRGLAKKWPNLTSEKKEIILDKIFTVFNQLNIPTNYWTVSLFIWIFEKNSEANIHNSFELIQLYVDNLLDRRRFALDKSLKIDFDDLKNFLAGLAHHLVTEFHTKAYTASYTDLVSYTEKYRSQNIRFVMPVKDILDLIIERNILRKETEDRYTFRLNGVFEYFIGYYMNNDTGYRNGIINDDHFYLSFGNELELCAGFNKKDKEFVEAIFNKTLGLFKPTFHTYGTVAIDSQLQLKLSEAFDLTGPIQELNSKLNKALPEEQQDELLEEFKQYDITQSEVKQKEFYDVIEPNSKNLEKALFILSRVFRNSSINDLTLSNKVVDFILDAACFLGFQLIDEIDKDSTEKDLSEDSNEEVLLQIAANFMPLIVQTFVFDALAQNNLERIFREKITELKKDVKANQFKLLILHFVLIDLDLKGNKSLINDVIEIINLGFLKHTTILKLHVYLMLKCGDNKELEKFIQDKIQEQTLKINPETDKGMIHKGIARAKKIKLINKRKNK